MMETGLTYTSTVVVSKENVAATMGSGDLNVFATPAMVALMENAAMSAVADELPEGSTTVGAMMNTTHIKPSAVGDTVSATAVLKEVEGRKLTFEVRAQDSKGVIGEGTHVRYIVDKEKFMSKLIKVQNIICSRERGSPVLSGDTQSCGTSDPYRVQNLFLRVGCGPFKHHFANFRHSTTSSLSSFLERYIGC